MMRIATHVVAVGLLMLGMTASAVHPDTIVRGWKPPVEFVADGNAHEAIGKMREMAALQRLLMNHTEFHQQTQTFVDGLWASLEHFDLHRFYQLLPEQQGEWRQLKVYGARNGGLYQMGPEASLLQKDARWQLGDLSALIRAKQIERDNKTSYLLTGKVDMGVGAVSWPAVVDATEETFRLVVEGDPQFDKVSRLTNDFVYRAKAHAMNPALSEQDISIIAPLWAAFPEMWNLLARLGQIEGVLLDDGRKDRPYRHLLVSFVLKPEQIKKRYPALAEHLDNLGSLMQLNIDLQDEQGSVLRAEFDSETLRGKLDAYVYDGQLLSVQNGRVLMPADRPGQQSAAPARLFVAHMNARMSILGVITHLTQLKSYVRYEKTEGGARISGHIVDVPGVKVEGRALGIMPTAVIDFFLPTNIDELMTEFLQVACKGNEGNGISAELGFLQGLPGEASKVTITTAFEGLDNFMVRIGMGIVSDRIIPDPQVSTEIRQLIFDAQEAFSKDLDHFEKVASL